MADNRIVQTAANQDKKLNPYSYQKLKDLKEMMDKNAAEDDDKLDKDLDEKMLDAWDEGLV